ncbi:actin-like ATPase domain-containing protein [Ceraceosorus guamensis]|uniref:Actin-like ATPase domain-containing protein n=1 Tax=Ceraceosorus guamensis TaxID=1522189 RepID=A0A316W0Q1_9BASI|nr:actin-like ATPase domain-containing protein [Ceraceosorus guamensis]PWN43370.1 actin-like ATPase domain-containing protein [Ceraceosorus guamensis]
MSTAAEGSSRHAGTAVGSNPLRSPTRTAATRSSAARQSTGGRSSAGGANVGSAVPSPSLHSRQRQSLFGESDRVVLDIGLSIARYGFEGESRPRGLLSTSQYSLWTPDFWKGCKDERARRSRELDLLVNITKLLRVIFHDLLLVDPRGRRIVLVENALLPDYAARTLCKVLFSNLQVANVALLPAPLISLLAVGRMTGLVLDVGTHHSRLTTVYYGRLLSSRPDILVTRRGSVRLKARLKNLLVYFGRYVAATPSTASRKQRTSKIKTELLDDAFLDDIIAKAIFVAQKPIEDVEEQRRSEIADVDTSDQARPAAATPAQSTFALTPTSGPQASSSALDIEDGAYDESKDEALMRQLQSRYAHTSRATSLILPVPSRELSDPHAPVLHNSTTSSASQQQQNQASGVIVVPNWIRERAVDVLFEPGDDDEKSLPEMICDALINLPIDMRIPLAKQMLVTGGVATMAGFAHRLKEEVTRLLDNCTIDQPHSVALTVPRVGAWSGKSEKSARKASRALADKDLNKAQVGAGGMDDQDTRGKDTTERKAPPREIMRYAPIAHLWQHVSLMNDHMPYIHSNGQAQGGDAPAFAPNVVAWVGASLAGSIRTTSLSERTKEAWEEAEAQERERLNRVGANDDAAGARPLFGSGRGSFVGVVGGIHTGAWGALSAHLRTGPRSPAPNPTAR